MPETKPNNQSGSLENIVGSDIKLQSLTGVQPPTYHPTDAEPKMRWDADGTGHIDMGGGAMVQGGYSISLNPNGENSVEFYRD